MRLTVGQAIVAFLTGQYSERDGAEHRLIEGCSIETDLLVPASDSNSWWDVPIAEVSELESVTKARQAYEAVRSYQRRYL